MHSILRGIKKIFRWLTRSESGQDSRISRLLVYIVLAGIGFVFVYPLLYMLSVSFMDTKDLVDSTVSWIPTRFYDDLIETNHERINKRITGHSKKADEPWKEKQGPCQGTTLFRC
jgi:ABC-type glycerol-3-phosphate transport system permease component